MIVGRSVRSPVYIITIVLAILTVCLNNSRVRSQEIVGLELALLIDVSASVDKDEYQLQLDGFAAAFSGEKVQQAIESPGGLVVCVIQWAQRAYQYKSIDWTVLSNKQDALKLATRIVAIPRQTPSGQTAIGDAIVFAMHELETNDYQGLRRVIDVSGDGIANDGRRLHSARREVLDKEITINALAIVNEFPDLKEYYRTRLIGGPGAFVLSARDYTDFARAISEKLEREIRAQPVARNPGKTRKMEALANILLQQ